MKFTESLETCSDKVEAIMKVHPATRDSDKLLWLAYLVVHHDLRKLLGDKAYTQFKDILLDKKTPTMESVTRARRKIQESGNYQGEKRAQRLDEQESVRQYYSK
jgi:hypothetical protein